MNAACADDTCSDSTAQSLACDILDMHEAGQLDLKKDHFDPNGNSPYDGAAVYDNIKDTCDGLVAKRYKTEKWQVNLFNPYLERLADHRTATLPEAACV